MFDYDAWRLAMGSAVDAVLARFQARFGYPPDDQLIGGPSSAEQLQAALDAGTVPDELLEFYRHVSRVDLPDVHNGFFVHPLSQVLDNEKNGTPVRAPALTGSGIVVFGSDGGGALFALDGTGSPVYLLPPGAVRDGTYEGRFDPPRVIAASLPEFLEWLRSVVEGFAAR
ncbi:SMI1/KNR4 family protein [Streptomyces sp. MN03-5084-2B]|nr:SMI1/KNR4 family protein [Streptomyces sp. MN03-5084-2B]